MLVGVPVDERALTFYQTAGLNVSMNEPGGEGATLDLGYCQHMEITEGFYKCKIYDDRPQMCRDYNCLAWASRLNVKENSPIFAHAMGVYKQMPESTSGDV